jgi:hypothetical protein
MAPANSSDAGALVLASAPALANRTADIANLDFMVGLLFGYDACRLPAGVNGRIAVR